MMRKILTSLVVVIAIAANGQTECKVSKEVDKFTDKISVYTPMISGLKASPVVLLKQIEKTDTAYYALFHLYGNSGYGKGCYVIFDDGEKWIKEEAQIKTSYVTAGRYLYQCIVTLSWEDVQRLINHRVTDLKLNDSRIELKDRNQENFICAAKKVLEN